MTLGDWDRNEQSYTHQMGCRTSRKVWGEKEVLDPWPVAEEVW